MGGMKMAETTTANNKYDIVFLLDDTGSMGSYWTNVKNNINTFATSLESRGIDFQLGLVAYGDINDSEIKKFEFTTDANTFVENVNSVSIYGGGDTPESGLEALESALTMNFREDAKKEFIVVTDADYHNSGETGDGDSSKYLNTADVVAKLKANGVQIDVIGKTESDCQTEWEKPIANETSSTSLTGTPTTGQFYDINGSFPDIFNKLTDEISGSTGATNQLAFAHWSYGYTPSSATDLETSYKVTDSALTGTAGASGSIDKTLKTSTGTTELSSSTSPIIAPGA